MWIALTASIVSIILFQKFDNRQISEQDLVTVSNLTVIETPYQNSGRRPLIGIKVQETERTLVISQEELACVNKGDILQNFKIGDKISISISRDKVDDFYQTTFIGKFQKIYGLIKDGEEYLEIDCRNNVSNEKTKSVTVASLSSGLLSLILAVFVYRPKDAKSKDNKKGLDPILIVCGCWLIVAILFRGT